MNTLIERRNLLPLWAAAMLFCPPLAALADGGGNEPGSGIIRPYEIGNPPAGAKEKTTTKPPAGTKAKPGADKSLAEEKRNLEKEIRDTEKAKKKNDKKMTRLIENDEKLEKKILDEREKFEDKKSAIREEYGQRMENETQCCVNEYERQRLYTEMLKKVDAVDAAFGRFYWKTVNDARSWEDPAAYDEFQELRKQQAENEKTLDRLNKALEKVKRALERPLVQP
ncbi:MAG TPA: hypothetical protein PLJ34_06280 [Hyphomicrobiales bacterium]|nr:hypothetical protein [Kaistiaceae bacterium]HQF31036.1 hypothetical protein [Hyphomicrobiales bacterium]